MPSVEDRNCVRPHCVIHIASLGVEQEGCGRRLVAQLHERRPAVRAVLLPEGAVWLEAAHVFLGLPHDFLAVSQRARGATLDSLRVGIETDAQQRLALARKSAETFEVTYSER